MKKALIVIGAIIAIILVVAAILPSESHVERSITINAPIDLVFDQVNDLRKNFNWSPWAEKDPEMKVEWGEKTSGTGGTYSWSGNSDVGSGTLTIAESVENEIIRNDIDFGEMGTGMGTWTFKPVVAEQDDGSVLQQVEVTWAMDSKLGYPIERYFGLFMDDLVGPDFEKGLSNLKQVSESLPVVPEVEVNEVQYDASRVVSLKDSVPMDIWQEKFGAMMGELATFVEDKKLTMTAPPRCYYHEWNTKDGYTIMEVAFPISLDAKVKGNDRIAVKDMEAGIAAMAIHTGSYENMEREHYAIDEWATENNRQIIGPPWEVYMADPMNEPDTSKWRTDIYYPIQ